MRGLVEGGVDLLLIETIFDTLNAKAAIVAAQEVAPGLPLLALVHGHRPQRAQPLRPDGRGVLDLGRARRAADRRRQLLARRGADAAVRRGPRAHRDDLHGVPSERRAAERVRRATTSSRPTRAASCASSREAGLVNVVGGCCGTTPEHIAAIAAAVAAVPSRDVSRPGERRPRFSGLEPFEIGPDTGFVMIGERTNVTGSARFRTLIEAGRLPGGDRGRAGAGARRREPARREHGRRPARVGAGDDDVPERGRHRAGGRPAADHGRQLALVGASRPASSASRARASSTRSASRRARSSSSSRRARSAATAPASS